MLSRERLRDFIAFDASSKAMDVFAACSKRLALWMLRRALASFWKSLAHICAFSVHVFRRWSMLFAAVVLFPLFAVSGLLFCAFFTYVTVVFLSEILVNLRE